MNENASECWSVDWVTFIHGVFKKSRCNEASNIPWSASHLDDLIHSSTMSENSFCGENIRWVFEADVHKKV